MDHDFIKAFQLEVLAGRPFSGELTNERKNVMINESAVRLMGFKTLEESINDEIFFWGDTFRIVGVLKDYHQESLKKAYEPLVFRYNESPGGFYSIKFNTGNMQASLAKFEDHWKSVFPGNPFIHFFLDDHYDQQYQNDQQFGKVFGIFSVLAIFIACLGLFGLASFTAEQRRKEVGIRKVMGATVAGILVLFSKDFLKLVVLAFLLGAPVAYLIMQHWLADFAYRIDISWPIFLMAGLAALGVALLTVSYQAVKAATADPVKSLRYE